MQSKLVSESQRCVDFCDGCRFQQNQNIDIAGCNGWAISLQMVSQFTSLDMLVMRTAGQEIYLMLTPPTPLLMTCC